MRLIQQHNLPNGRSRRWRPLDIGQIASDSALSVYSLLTFAIVATNAAAASQAQLIADRAFGFGSVNVSFQSSPAYSLTNNIVGTQSGVINYVGNYGRSAESAEMTPAAQSASPTIADRGIGSLSDFTNVRVINVDFEHIAVSDSLGLQTADVCGFYWLTGGDNRPAASFGTISPANGLVRSTQEFEFTSIDAGNAGQL